MTRYPIVPIFLWSNEGTGKTWWWQSISSNIFHAYFGCVYRWAWKQMKIVFGKLLSDVEEVIFSVEWSLQCDVNVYGCGCRFYMTFLIVSFTHATLIWSTTSLLYHTRQKHTGIIRAEILYFGSCIYWNLYFVFA